MVSNGKADLILLHLSAAGGGGNSGFFFDGIDDANGVTEVDGNMGLFGDGIELMLLLRKR